MAVIEIFLLARVRMGKKEELKLRVATKTGFLTTNTVSAVSEICLLGRYGSQTWLQDMSITSQGLQGN